MPPKSSDIETKDKNRMVTVTEDGDKVTVRWTCGNERMFTKETLREVLKNFEFVSSVGKDLIYTDIDMNGNKFYLRLVDGRIEVDEQLFGTGSYEDSSIPYSKFRAAVVRHTKPPAKSRAKAKK